MSKEELLPKLRFEDFSTVWEKRTLGELGNVAMNKRIFKNQTSEKGDIPFYKIGTFGKEPDAYISRELFDEYKSKYSYPKIGDILISASGSIGRTVEYKGRDEYFQDSNIVWLNHNGKIDNHFLKQFYKIVTWHGLEGSTIKRLYNSNILNTEIILPILEEQNKIGSFFRKIDQMIQVQQSKVNKVKDIKSAYLSEMFPKEGEKYPKKRFEGFTKAWEFKNLETLTTTFTDGDWIESKDQSESGVRLIQTGNIGVTQFLDKPNNRKWISESTFKKLNCEEIYPGDILISRLPEPAGRATIVPKLNTRMITAVDCTIVRPSSEYSSDFLIQYLCTSNYFNKITAELAGGTRQRISRSNLAEIKVPVPKTLEEQEKIGQFFKNLDNQISTEEEKLVKLKKLKQAYLNDMFV